MCVDGLFDIDDYSSKMNFYYDTSQRNETARFDIYTKNVAMAKIILSSFEMTSSGKSFKFEPMKGSVSVSAEKDSEGNTKAEGEITISSDDGTYSVSGSGSVDQDGNVSGKVEASISWEKEN